MDSPVSVEARSPEEPRRLSALYQYHNAPEVAPAHGLEYDDTIYPASDKFPVIRERIERIHHYTGKHAYNDNRPPRIIFGMKVKTFLVVATIMALIIVGAAVGGAVGGKDIHQGVPTPGLVEGGTGTNSTGSATSTPKATQRPTPTASTTFSAPTPTYTPLSDCPASNGTTYVSELTDVSDPGTSGLNFTKYCDLSAPSVEQINLQITRGFVYSFSDCIEICAAYNRLNNNNECNVAVYTPDDSRPSNCWVGGSQDVSSSSLTELDGSDVAILNVQS